jgi:NADH-quinone oxidoreductase subunit C
VSCYPTREQYVELVRAFKDDGFEMCVDLCGVDYLEHPDRALPPGVARTRFEVVVNLLSLSKAPAGPYPRPGRRRARGRLAVRALSGHRGHGARGLRPLRRLFRGHPDLTRILMPEEWEGHPLRKDYGSGRVPVQFKEAPGAAMSDDTVRTVERVELLTAETSEGARSSSVASDDRDRTRARGRRGPALPGTPSIPTRSTTTVATTRR